MTAKRRTPTAEQLPTQPGEVTHRASESLASTRALLTAIERGEFDADIHLVWYLRGVAAGLEALLAGQSPEPYL